ncbi:MAG: GTPase HflX [Deltaproteobacteria bacterium]|nr:GTPase HflX [Deltaproteobacteria bacterium]
MPEPTIDPPAAVRIAVQLPGVSTADLASELDELARLVKTLGLETTAVLTQRRSSLAAAAVLGKGKLKELARLTGGTGVVPSGAAARKSKARDRDEESPSEAEASDDLDPEDEASPGEGDGPSVAPVLRRATLVVVDHEITPSQARNLERATGVQVLDRAGVIVEIFHRHARSREARLQVELARLSYVAPRLRETGGGGDRQRGGIGGRGAGESEVELDRRKIRDRMAELREELAAVQREQQTRRTHRREQLRVALVGYTNAGKSSLMRALTGSEVLVADKLFATLDTTVRALQPEVRPRVLVSDTVGFIKKLPHELVASFRSTLDEALEASLLLYVVDAADPMHREQLATTRSVLAEIGASEVPGRLLLNKADRLSGEQRAALKAEYPEALLLSAMSPGDVATLRESIIAFFETSMVEAELLVPYGKQGLLGRVHEETHVLSEQYDQQGARLRVRAQPAGLERLQLLLAS